MANWTDVKWDYGNIITLNKITNQTQNVVYLKEEGHDVQFLGGGHMTRSFATGNEFSATIRAKIDDKNITTTSSVYVPRSKFPSINGVGDFDYQYDMLNVPISNYPNGTLTFTIDVDGGDPITIRFIKTKAMNYLTALYRPAMTHRGDGESLVGGTFGICGFVLYGHTDTITWSRN